MNRGDLDRGLDYDRPFGLYLHIPFCRRKCYYCDFYSLPCSGGEIPEEIAGGFIRSIIREAHIYARNISCRDIRTVYLGGGTPSLLSPDRVDQLLTSISRDFYLPEAAEITLEANPADLSRDKLSGYRQAGVNRLSVGVQSFHDRELQLLGRLHSSARAVEVLEIVRELFPNYSLDLMFALPGQTSEMWRKSLSRALSFDPAHLSLYNLQIEPGTKLADRLAAGEITEIDNYLDAEMYQLARDMLAEQGYRQYEISNFAREDRQSRHNLIYWHYQPYLGLGPGAHSFTGSCRFNNPASLEHYLDSLSRKRLPAGEPVRLSQRELMAETIFMGLRLLNGISLVGFNDRTGRDLIVTYRQQLDRLTELGLVVLEQGKFGRLFLTEKGLFLGNEVFVEFL